MSEWISVKDRLPSEGEGMVLTFIKSEYGNYIKEAFYSYHDVPLGRWLSAPRGFPFFKEEVTHWQRLPEAPK